MSWHYSRALVAEFLEATCSDGEQSARLKESLTQQAYLCKDRMTAFSRLSRYGMTFAPLTERLGVELLMWFQAGSRVRTYQLPGMEPGLMASAQAYGEKWHELSVRYDLDSSSWRIHLSLFPEDLQWSSVTLPKWGMTRSGAVYQHPTAERPISAIGSGLWPTPRSCSAMAATITPESAWQENRFPNLETVVGRRMWPTPCATDYKGAPSPSATERRQQESARGVRLPEEIARTGESGQMNPAWVEWLMGWPLGWTDLKPLEMDKFQEWLQQHSQS